MKLTVKKWCGLVLGVVLAQLALGAWADEAGDAQAVVDKARATLADFLADPEMTWFRNNLGSAQAVLIVPEQIKAGFIIGGSGGGGVLLARDKATGRWSQPAFYNLGAGSIGLQIGAQVSQVMLMVRTQKGVDALLSTKVQLGAGASVAAGPVGAGAEAATADVLSFVRAKGAFAGASLEGAVVSPSSNRNAAYYGKPASASDIVVRRSVSNPGAASLISELTKATAKK